MEAALVTIVLLQLFSEVERRRRDAKLMRTLARLRLDVSGLKLAVRKGSVDVKRCEKVISDVNDAVEELDKDVRDLIAEIDSTRRTANDAMKESTAVSLQVTQLSNRIRSNGGA
jgi:peptidoglycan hydrolase CwlO-like protein